MTIKIINKSGFGFPAIMDSPHYAVGISVVVLSRSDSLNIVK
jgi:hypothetical protein